MNYHILDDLPPAQEAIKLKLTAWKQYALTLTSLNDLKNHMAHLRQSNHLISEDLYEREAGLLKLRLDQKIHLLALGEKLDEWSIKQATVEL